MSNEWTHIDKGLPPCDSETVYVGINSAGYYACFTDVSEMDAGRGPAEIVQWMRLEMPGE